jgi:hypothetical protein
MFAPLRTLLKSSMLTLAVVAGLTISGREVKAQGTYIGTFAMFNGWSGQFLTDPNGWTNAGIDMFQYDWRAYPCQEWDFSLLPNGFWTIRNRASGLYLEDQLFSKAIDQNYYYGGTNQQWFLCRMTGNFYALVNVASGKILTDPGASTQEGTYIDQEGWFDGLDQWWYLYFLWN